MTFFSPCWKGSAQTRWADRPFPRQRPLTTVRSCRVLCEAQAGGGRCGTRLLLCFSLSLECPRAQTSPAAAPGTPAAGIRAAPSVCPLPALPLTAPSLCGVHRIKHEVGFTAESSPPPAASLLWCPQALSGHIPVWTSGSPLESWLWTHTTSSVIQISDLGIIGITTGIMFRETQKSTRLAVRPQ